MTQTSSNPKRIALFGGSFDPIHFGHLIMAQDAFEQLELDEVIFVPARQSPLKTEHPGADGAERLAILEAAVAAAPHFSVSNFELSSEAISYSIETARYFSTACPGSKLFWLIGADQAQQLSDWRAIEELTQIIEFGVFDRSNIEYDKSLRKKRIPYQKIDARRIDISSTEIRKRLARGLPVNNFLPAASIEIITSRKLYRP